MGTGLYIEEDLQEILGRFRQIVERDFHHSEPSLSLAAPMLLQDLARALRSNAPSPEPWRRSLLLIYSQPEGGIRGLVREFAALRRALWDTLAAREHACPGIERRRVDWMLDEALASAADRWAGLARLLTSAQRPPPLPRRGQARAAPQKLDRPR
jgi:hypothetical protein